MFSNNSNLRLESGRNWELKPVAEEAFAQVLPNFVKRSERRFFGCKPKDMTKS